MKIFIKPRAGLTIPDPFRRDLLPAAGREVLKGPYWVRRIKDGDVFVAQPETGKAGKK